MPDRKVIIMNAHTRMQSLLSGLVSVLKSLSVENPDLEMEDLFYIFFKALLFYMTEAGTLVDKRATDIESVVAISTLNVLSEYVEDGDCLVITSIEEAEKLKEKLIIRS